MAWMQGRYFFDAVSIAMYNSFKDKRKKSMDYVEEPYITKMEREHSEEYIRSKRQEFLAGLETMMVNFNIEKEAKEMSE